jgi:hypothetical protein
MATVFWVSHFCIGKENVRRLACTFTMHPPIGLVDMIFHLNFARIKRSESTNQKSNFPTISASNTASQISGTFCEYVKQKEQTPTFPILISPTDAATESQLKLFAENPSLSTDLNGSEAEYAVKKSSVHPRRA